MADNEHRNYGYARVSTDEQTLDQQFSRLKAAGCTELYHDVVSGAEDERPELNELLDKLTAGDVITVVSLDRLGRSTPYLLKLVDEFESKRVQFRSLNEGMDTTQPAGRMIFTVLAAVSEMERKLISERTKAKLTQLKSDGATLGRPLSMRPAQIRQAVRMRENGASYKTIAEQYNVSKQTAMKHVKKAIEEIERNETSHETN